MKKYYRLQRRIKTMKEKCLRLILFVVIICQKRFILADHGKFVRGGMFLNNKYMNLNTLTVFNNIGPKMCIRRCLLFTNCKAVNFNKDTYTCQLLNSPLSDCEIITKAGYMFTTKENWDMDTSVCWPNTCPKGTQCIVTDCNEKLCLQKVTPCNTSPCQNGGTCSISGANYECACLSGYYGTNCEMTPCSVGPCQNGGNCVISGSSYYCNCPAGYSGTHCQITPCTIQNCGQETCYNSGSTNYCSCYSGYSGTHCDLYYWTSYSLDSYVNNAVQEFGPTTVTTGFTILLRFTYFNTESGCDHVRIYDGTSANDTLLAERSGQSIGDDVVTTGNSIFVTWETDHSVIAGGWNASLYRKG